MIQNSFQPFFHLINSFLPSVASFMVFSAVMQALPNFGKKGKQQMKQAQVSLFKRRQAAPLPTNVKVYTIPTSMRTPTSRNF